MHLVPGVANRGVDVAHMQLVWRGDDPFGHQVIAAQHQGVAGEIELFDRQRQQGQVLLNVTDPPGQPLDEAGGHRATLQPASRTLALPIHQGEQIRRSPLFAKEPVQLPHHKLSSLPPSGA
jgi:hypothetical protein